MRVVLPESFKEKRAFINRRDECWIIPCRFGDMLELSVKAVLFFFFPMVKRYRFQLSISGYYRKLMSCYTCFKPCLTVNLKKKKKVIRRHGQYEVIISQL